MKSKNMIFHWKPHTDEPVVEWAVNKYRKECFNLLWQLSARLDDFFFSSWNLDLENSCLVIINFKYKTNQIFCIGSDVSHTKARNDTASRIINELGLFQ